MKLVLCNNDEISYKFFICWMAYGIQQPTEKVGVVCCFKGSYDENKAFFDWYGGAIYGPYYHQLGSLKELTDKKRSEGKLFCVLNEIHNYSNRLKTIAKMKYVISECETCVQPPYAVGYKFRDYCNYVMLNKNSFPINDSLRYALFDCGSCDPEYLSHLQLALTDKNAAILFRYLNQYNITNWKRTKISAQCMSA